MLVMFDLDGTLTDPYDGITRSVAHAFQQLGRQVPAADALRRFIGPPLQDSFAQWLPEALAAEAIDRYRERFGDLGWRENHVYDGIPAMLASIEGNGHQLVVVTSKPTVFAERILTHFGLRGHFSDVFGATLDGTLRHKADLVRLALSATYCSAGEAVMVGDRSQDVIGARASHVKAIGVGWGYAESGELEDAGAHAIAGSPAELPPLLGQST